VFGFIGDDPGPEPLPRERIVAFHMCWAILVPAFCYVFTADAPLVFLIALALAGFSLVKKTSFRLSNRAKVYSFVFPLIFAAIFDMFYKVDMNHFFMSVSTLCPLLIFYGLSVSLLDQRPVSLATGMACALGAMLIQGLTLSPPDLKRIAVPHPFLLDRFRLFILAVLAQSYSILHLPRLAIALNRDVRSERVGRQLVRSALTTGATILVFAVSLGVCFGAKKTFRLLDPVFADSYRNFLERKSRKTLFRDRISTDSTLSWKLNKYGNMPAFFVKSSVAPGYMRGRSYTRYVNGEWRAERLRDGNWVPDAPTVLPLTSGTGGLSTSSWVSEGLEKDELESADVYFANRFAPGELYLPGNTCGIELVADRLNGSTDGIYLPGGWDESSGYRYFVKNVDQAAALPRPATPGDEYLQISDTVMPTAYMHAQLAIKDGAKSTKEKILAVTTYLSRNFSYSLAPKKKRPKDTDPVVHFLRTSQEGHCELFASAAVAMLRSQGIKCRYVTGFVCFEQLPAGAHVARFKHCHAWAEAWIPDEGWTYLEPTPASGVPEKKHTSGLTALGESIQNWLTHLLSGVKRGYFAQAVISGFFAVVRALDAVFLSLYGLIAWPVLLLLLRMSVVHYRRRREPKVVHPNGKLFREIRQVLMTFLRKRGIVYEPDMSLRDISVELADDRDFETLMKEYERLRYGPDAADEDVIAFSKRFSEWTRRYAVPMNEPNEQT
jgi:transglutaminase-like putative cysteine protease